MSSPNSEVRVLVIEDATTASEIANGATELPDIGSILEADLVLFRQESTYQVLRCKFAYPEAFLFGVIPDAGTPLEADPVVQEAKTVIHMTTPGMTLLVQETRDEVEEQFNSLGSIELTGLVTVAQPKDGQPARFWEAITVTSGNIAYMANFHL